MAGPSGIERKSKKKNAAKSNARNKENGEYRARLHREKHHQSMTTRSRVQGDIDQISKRGS